MSSYKNLFPGSTTILGRFPTHTSDASEIDLRAEMSDILYGTDGSVPKGQYFILRRMRTDSGGDLVPCECVDAVTREPDIDYPCPFCRGEGYLWDEEVVTGYKVNVSSISSSRAFDLVKETFGVLSLPAIVFYFDYLTEPSIRDKIITIELGLDGTPVEPPNRLVSYEINLLRDMRSDRGRVEYWACYCASEGIATKADLP